MIGKRQKKPPLCQSRITFDRTAADIKFGKLTQFREGQRTPAYGISACRQEPMMPNKPLHRIRNRRKNWNASDVRLANWGTIDRVFLSFLS